MTAHKPVALSKTVHKPEALGRTVRNWPEAADCVDIPQ